MITLVLVGINLSLIVACIAHICFIIFSHFTSSLLTKTLFSFVLNFTLRRLAFRLLLALFSCRNSEEKRN